MTSVVAALAGLAVWLALVPTADRAASPKAHRHAMATVVAAGLAVLVIGFPARRIVLAVIVLASAGDLARRIRRRRRRAAAESRSALLLETCESLAVDLRAGLPPVRALDAAAGDWPEFAAVARAARLGSDVPEAMRALGSLPGARQVRVLAAAWQVAHRSGAGLAPALELAGTTLREERVTAGVVASELASARSTASILAVLPVVVLAIGSGAGGDPFGFLTGTTPGLFCLASGLLLAHLGLAWLDAIADGVGR